MVADNDLLTVCASFAVLGGTKLALKVQQLSPRPWSATRHSKCSSKSLLGSVMVANVVRYRRGSGIRRVVADNELLTSCASFAALLGVLTTARDISGQRVRRTSHEPYWSTAHW